MKQTAVAILVAGLVVAGTFMVGGSRAVQNADVGRYQLQSYSRMAFRLDTVTGEIAACLSRGEPPIVACSRPVPWTE